MDKVSANHEGVCVAIRMRPMNTREKEDGQSKSFASDTDESNTITQFRDGQPIDAFSFDKVFEETSNNEGVYTHVAKRIVTSVANGFNGTIFAYGQTSSGKTHTMLGSSGEKGIIALAVDDIFQHITECPGRDFLIKVSFVEIYNEIIRDLLSDAQDSTVKIRVDPRKGIYCEATEVGITDYESIGRLLAKGISRRSVRSTNMNDQSSRSHTIFKLIIESKNSAREGQDVDEAVLASSLNLVDLAGSESVRHTGASGQGAKEGGNINKSLLTLSRVVQALASGDAKPPFRDSELTFLLQPSLSGNAKMAIVCCVTAASGFVQETKSTLQFAARAKLVKTNAGKNEFLDDRAKMRRMEKELLALRERERKGGITEEERQQLTQLESEKSNLQASIESLQQEKEQNKCEIDRLRELNKHLIIHGGGAGGAVGPRDKPKKSKHRETWHAPRGDAMQFAFLPAAAAAGAMRLERLTALSEDCDEDGEAAVTPHASSKHSSHAVSPLTFGGGGGAGTADSSKRKCVDRSSTGSLDSDGNDISFKVNDISAIVGDHGSADQLADALKKIVEITAENESKVTMLDDSKKTIATLQKQVEKLAALVARKDDEMDALIAEHDVEMSANAECEQEWAEERRILQMKLAETENRANEREHQLLEELSLANEKIKSLEQMLQNNKHEVEEDVNESVNISNASSVSDIQLMRACDPHSPQSSYVLSTMMDEVGEAEEIDFNPRASVRCSLAKSVLNDAEDVGLMDHTLGFDDKLYGMEDIEFPQDYLTGPLPHPVDAAALVHVLVPSAVKAVKFVDASDVLKEEEAQVRQPEEQQQQQQQQHNDCMEESSLIVAGGDDHQEKIRLLTCELESVQQQFTEYRHQAADELKQATEQLNAGIVSLQQRWECAQAEVERMQAAVLTATSDNSANAAVNAAASAALTEALASSAVKDEAIQELRDQVQILEMQITLQQERFEQEQVHSVPDNRSEMEQALSLAREQLDEAKNENDNLLEDIHVLESRVAELETDMQSSLEREEKLSIAIAQCDEIEDDRSTLLQQIAELESQLESSVFELQTERDRVGQAASHINDLSEKLTQAVLQDQRAQDSIVALTIERDALMGDILRLRGELLEAQVATASIEELERQLGESMATIQSLQSSLAATEVNTAVETLQAADVMVVSGLQQEILRLSEAVDQLEKRAHSQQSQLVDAANSRLLEQTRADNAESELKGLRQSQSVQQHQNLADKDAEDGLRREFERMANQYEAQLGGRDGEISRLMAQVTTLNQRAEHAEQALTASQNRENVACGDDESQRKRLGQLQTMVDLLKGDKDALTLRCQQLEQQLKSVSDSAVLRQEKLENELHAALSKAGQSQEASGQVDRLRSAVAALETRMASVTAERDDLKSDAELASTRIHDLELHCDNLCDKLRKLEGSGDGHAIQQLETSLKEALEREKESRSNAHEKDREIAELSSRLRKAKEEVAMIQGEWARTDEVIRSLESQVAAVSSERDHTQSELNAAFDEIQELTNALAEADSTKDASHLLRMQETIDALESELRQAEEKLAQPSMSTPEVEAAMAEVQGRLQETQRIADEANQAADEFESLLKNAIAERDSLEAEVESLHEEVDHCTTTIASLEAQLSVQLATATSASLDIAGADDGAHRSEEMAALYEAKASLEASVNDQRHYISEMEAKITHLQLHVHSLQAQGQVQPLCHAMDSQLHTAHEELTSLRNELQEVRDSAAADAELFKQAAELQMESLRGQLRAASNRGRDLEGNIAKLESDLIEKDDIIAQIENDLYSVKQELHELQDSEARRESLAGSEVGSSTLTADLKDAQAAKTSLISQLTTLKEDYRQLSHDLRAANDHNSLCESMLEAIRIEMASLREEKDQRIAHLEKHKFTSEHMRKFKDLKEERDKYKESSSTMKKQLADLKKAYDVKSMAQNEELGSAAQLSQELGEARQELATVQKTSKMMKEKLFKCSEQIKEYEIQQRDVIDVLSLHGINTAGLLEDSICQSDCASNASASVLGQERDLAGAVAQLADKLSAARSTIAQLTQKSNTSSSTSAAKISDLEEKLAESEATITELQAQQSVLQKRLDAMNAKLRDQQAATEKAGDDQRDHKGSLEKKIETMKSSLRQSREEVASLTTELQLARQQLVDAHDKVELLTSRAENAEAKICTMVSPSAARRSSLDGSTASELEALKEENLDLMKENKDLRCELQAIRVTGGTATSRHNSSSLISDAAGGFGNEENMGMACEQDSKTVVRQRSEPAMADFGLGLGLGAKQQSARTFGSDITSRVSQNESSLLPSATAADGRLGGSSKTRRESEAEAPSSTIRGSTASSVTTLEAEVSGVAKRSRRVKAEPVAVSAQAPDGGSDAPGECAQS